MSFVLNINGLTPKSVGCVLQHFRLTWDAVEAVRLMVTKQVAIIALLLQLWTLNISVAVKQADMTIKTDFELAWFNALSDTFVVFECRQLNFVFQCIR